MKKKLLLIVAIFALALWVVPASALTTTQTFPIFGTLDSLPVSGVAKFTLDSTADTITVDVWNTQANPTSVIQCISDLFFSLNDGNTSGSLTSSSGLERTVNGSTPPNPAHNTFTDGSVVGTGWGLTINGTTYHLNDLGFAGPTHTIIGAPDPANPALYSAANSSIAGNTAHNPFLFAATEAGAVQFVLDFTGLTDDTRVENVILSFGTSPGANVPVPPSALLLGSGILGLGILRFRRS